MADLLRDITAATGPVVESVRVLIKPALGAVSPYVSVAVNHLEAFAVQAEPHIDASMAAAQNGLLAVSEYSARVLDKAGPLIDETVALVGQAASEAGPALHRTINFVKDGAVDAYRVAEPIAVSAYNTGLETSTAAWRKSVELASTAAEAVGPAADAARTRGLQASLQVREVIGNHVDAHLQPLLRSRGITVSSASIADAVFFLHVFLAGLVLASVLRSALTALCCRSAASRGRVVGGKAAAKKAPAPFVASKPGCAYVCTACKVVLPGGEEPEALGRHTAGKRHDKAVKEAAGGAKGAFAWVTDAEWAAMRPATPAPTSASSGSGSGSGGAHDEEDGDDDARGGPLVARRAPAATGGVVLHGKNVAVVHGQDTLDHGGSGGWTTVKGGTSASAAGAKSLGVANRLLHMVGGRNLLEGISVVAEFVSSNADSQVLKTVNDAILAAQSRAGGLRLRRDTYTASRDGVAAALHYGAFVEVGSSERALRDKLVEPLPPPLAEVARKVGAKAAALGLPHGWAPDCATVYVLEPGMHLPPRLLAGGDDDGSFVGPRLTVALGGSGEVLLGSTVDPVLNASSGAPVPGEYSASYALAVPRRSLVVWDEPCVSEVQQGVGRVRNRVVLVEFRRMARAVRDEAVARGNAA